MTPLPHFASYNGQPAGDYQDEGMMDNYDDGMDSMPMQPMQHQGATGPTAMAEMLLGAELLGTLCRRSRRRLRDIQTNCQVIMKLDRPRGILRIYGPEVCIEAAQKQLSSLGGPRKTVPAAVWAELMRTRTLQSSKQAIVLLLQELSGCRIHIERSRHEVRIFGPQNGIVVAEKLIEELEKQCVEEAVPARNTELLCMASLQEMAHTLGVTLRLEEGQMIVLGLQDRVRLAVREVTKYTEDPDGYSMQLSPEESDVLTNCGPVLRVDGQDLSDIGNGAGTSRGSSSSGDMPLPAPQQMPMMNQKQPVRNQQGGRPLLVAARQAQAFEQLGGRQAGGKQAEGGGVCPTCGVGRFCLFCGQPTWVYDFNSGAWMEQGAHCHGGPGRQAAHHGPGPKQRQANPNRGQWCAPVKPMQQGVAGGDRAQRPGRMFFGEVQGTNGSARGAGPAQPASLPNVPGDVSPAGSGTPMMRPSPVQSYVPMEALEGNQCTVGPAANGLVMGGMMPMCFQMNVATDQNQQMPWVGNVPVTMAQGYADGAGNGNQMMRHVYMVPAYPPMRDEPSSVQF